MNAGAKAKRVVFLAILAMTVFFVRSAYADHQGEAKTLNLESFVTEAFDKNQGLRAKKNEYESKRKQVFAAFLPEDPMVGVDFEGQSDFFDFDSRMNKEYMLSQTIPFPTKLLLRGSVAAKESAMAYQEYLEEVRDLIWHIEQPYYELYMVDKSLAVLHENQALLDQIAKVVKARYESNQVMQDEYLKAQIELEKNGIELFDMQEKKNLAQAHFAHIVNEPLHTQYSLGDEEMRSKLTFSRDEMEKLALEKRPELQMLRIAIEKAKASGRLIQTEWLPDITGRLEEREFEEADKARERDAFIGISVPVWSLVKGVTGSWQAANDDVAAAEATYADMKNEVLLKIHEGYSKVKSAQNRIDAYENSILPQSRQQVEVALSSYASGKTIFLSLIDAQRNLKMAQMEYYESIAQFEMGLSDLRLAVGDDLKSNQEELRK